jgi:hypothetical protein
MRSSGASPLAGCRSGWDEGGAEFGSAFASPGVPVVRGIPGELARAGGGCQGPRALKQLPGAIDSSEESLRRFAEASAQAAHQTDCTCLYCLKSPSFVTS